MQLVQDGRLSGGVQTELWLARRRGDWGEEGTSEKEREGRVSLSACRHRRRRSTTKGRKKNCCKKKRGPLSATSPRSPARRFPLPLWSTTPPRRALRARGGGRSADWRKEGGRASVLLQRRRRRGEDTRWMPFFFASSSTAVVDDGDTRKEPRCPLFWEPSRDSWIVPRTWEAPGEPRACSRLVESTRRGGEKEREKRRGEEMMHRARWAAFFLSLSTIDRFFRSLFFDVSHRFCCCCCSPSGCASRASRRGGRTAS